MNKFIYYIIIILLVFTSCKEADMAPEQERSHIKFYGGSYQAEGSDIKQLSDGCYVALGTISFSETSKSMYLLKTDKYGNEIWSKTIPDTISKTGLSFQVMPDGGFILLGNTITSPTKISIVRTDANGDTLWTRKISSTNGIKGYSIKPTSDSGFVIAGSIYATADDMDVMLYIVDSVGKNGIIKTVSWDGNDEAKDVIELKRGLYLTAGYKANASINGSNAYAWIFKIDADDPSGNDFIEKIKNSSLEKIKLVDSLHYLMCGQITSTDSSINTFVAKIKIGIPSDEYRVVTQWKKSIGIKNKDFATSCEMVSDNDFAILGTSTNDLGQTSMTLYKIDSLGNETQTKKDFGGTTGSSVSQSGNCIFKTQDGGLVTTGVNSYSKTSLLSIIKFDSNGNF